MATRKVKKVSIEKFIKSKRSKNKKCKKSKKCKKNKKSKKSKKNKKSKKFKRSRKRRVKYKMFSQSNPQDLADIAAKILVDNIKTLVSYQSGKMNHLENLKIIDNIPYIHEEIKILIVNKYFKKYNVNHKHIKQYLFEAVNTCNENDLSLLLRIGGSRKEMSDYINHQGTSGGDRAWPGNQHTNANKNRYTLLLMTIMSNCRNKENIVKLLLDYGADPRKTTISGHTALYLEENSWAPLGQERGNPNIKTMLREAMEQRKRSRLSYKMSKKQVETSQELKTSEEPHIYQEHQNLKEIIDKNNLQEEIKKGNCVLIFYMKSCPYCIKLREVIFQLCEKGMKVVIMERKKLDDEIKKEYKVEGYPTIYIIKKDGSKELYVDKRDVKSISSKF